MTIKNFLDYTGDISKLLPFLSLGYVEKEHGFKIDKFARAELQNNKLVTIASFNEGIIVNNFKPFNDNLDDLFISSSSASDTHEITIFYINGNRENKEAIVSLTGETSVNLSAVFEESIYCIWRMENNTSVDNAGTIEVANVVNDIYCNMPLTSGIQANTSLTGIFSVPVGYVGVIIDISITTDKGADAKGAIFTRELGKVFKYSKALSSYQNQATYKSLYTVITEKTDILPVAIAQTGGVIYLDYTMLVLKKEYLGKNLKDNNL